MSTRNGSQRSLENKNLNLYELSEMQSLKMIDK